MYEVRGKDGLGGKEKRGPGLLRTCTDVPRRCGAIAVGDLPGCVSLDKGTGL